jgi:hypothetical protein
MYVRHRRTTVASRFCARQTPPAAESLSRGFRRSNHAIVRTATETHG